MRSRNAKGRRFGPDSARWQGSSSRRFRYGSSTPIKARPRPYGGVWRSAVPAPSLHSSAPSRFISCSRGARDEGATEKKPLGLVSTEGFFVLRSADPVLFVVVGSRRYLSLGALEYRLGIVRKLRPERHEEAPQPARQQPPHSLLVFIAPAHAERTRRRPRCSDAGATVRETP